MRPAAQLALQTESERVDLSFGLDAGFGRNASGGVEDESPFQTAPPFEQPFRLGAPDGRNLAHFFNHIGGGLNAVREQSRFYGRHYALDLGVIDLELIEEFDELSPSRFGFQLLKPELSDLRQVFVGLFLIPQFIPLGAPSLAPRFAVVLFLKPSRRFFRLMPAGFDFLHCMVAVRSTLAIVQAANPAKISRKKASGKPTSIGIATPAKTENLSARMKRVRMSRAKSATSADGARGVNLLSDRIIGAPGDLTLSIPFQISSSRKCPRRESSPGSRILKSRTRA